MPINLHKIISGGQTGADRAGLKAAKLCGYATGGCMPKGFKAQDGLHPEFAALYGMEEHHSDKYPPRTECNVKDSDGTLRFASNFSSPGEVLTMKFIQLYAKPVLSVNVCKNNNEIDIANWILQNNIGVLNIAGNSERTSPGIENYVYKLMVKVLEYYKQSVK